MTEYMESKMAMARHLKSSLMLFVCIIMVIMVVVDAARPILPVKAALLELVHLVLVPIVKLTLQPICGSASHHCQ